MRETSEYWGQNIRDGKKYDGLLVSCDGSRYFPYQVLWDWQQRDDDTFGYDDNHIELADVSNEAYYGRLPELTDSDLPSLIGGEKRRE
jgi:hypothetical protein